MSDVAQWLEALGLSQYGTAFAENDVDLGVLPELAESDLERLGVSLGHRKKLLKAIAALSEDVTASAEIVEAPTGIAPPAPGSHHLAEIVRGVKFKDGEKLTQSAA